MDHLLWPFLYFLFPLLSLAGQPSTVSLDRSLIDRIPLCAQACVESFILEEFPISFCSPLQDLECLCTRNSVSGFTLGEGSFRCIASSCVDRDLSSDWMVYGICSGINGAKPMTHKTLTAAQPTPTPPSTIVRKLSRSEKSSSSHGLSSNKPMTSTVISFTSTSFPRATSTSSDVRSSTGRGASTNSLLTSSTNSPSNQVSSDSTASSVATSSLLASAPPASANKPSLTKPQVAGVVVVGVAGVLIALGVVFFICCGRQKRWREGKGKRSRSSSFVGDGIFDTVPNTTGPSAARNRDVEQGHMSRDLTIINHQLGSITPRRNNDSQTSLLGGNLHPDEIGIAVAPEMREISRVDETPPSAASYRTTSKLLPDKPSYSLYPSPLRIKPIGCQKNSATSPLLGEAEAGQTSITTLSRPSPRARNTSQSQLQHGYSPLRPSASDPFLDSQSNPRSKIFTNERRRPLQLETPSNDRSTPEALNGKWTRSLDNLHKPVPARQSSSARGMNQHNHGFASISPSEYTGRPFFDPSGAVYSQPRKPVPAKSRRSIQRRPSTRYSNASDTSFETTFEEDETPPLPVIQPILSPVQESPALRSARTLAVRPGFSTSTASRQLEQLPELESPTHKPIRRRQPQPAPLVTQNLSQKKPKGILKPLPNVPELPDDSIGTFPSQQYMQTPTTIATESDRDSGDVTKTAKWKILVSPGIGGIDNTGTPRSRKSVEWADRTGDIRIRSPLTPTKRDVR